MQENVSVLLATIVAVIIIVLFPIYNVATRQDSMSNTVVVKLTTNFVDEVRYKGYLSSEDYEEFLTELGKTGNLYDIELEVYKPILIEDKLEDGEVIYEEEYEITYTEDILKTLNGEERNDEIASNKMTLGENVYYMDQDYKFYVRIRNTNTTQAQVLLGRLFGGEASERIVVNYGGIVYDNEWKNSEDATVVESNIFISRPMDYYEEEYKYEYIATIYDPQTEQSNKMYGIAVRLRDQDVDKNSGIVKFRLTYKDIKPFRDDEGNLLNQTERIEHIKNNINFESSDGVPITSDPIEIIEEKYQGEDGKYQAEYLITIKNIVYDYNSNPYVRARVRVEAGSGESEAGTLGELKSKEFIIFYEINLPEITEFKEITNPIKIKDGIALTEVKTIIDFRVKAKIKSSVATIRKIVFKIEKDGVLYDTIEINNTDVAEITNNEFPLGKYKITTYAIDTRGHISEEKYMEFHVGNRITIKGSMPIKDKTHNTAIVTKDHIGVENKNNWAIESYKFWTDMPNHNAYSDFFKVAGTNSTGKIDIDPYVYIPPYAERWRYFTEYPTGLDLYYEWQHCNTWGCADNFSPYDPSGRGYVVQLVGWIYYKNDYSIVSLNEGIPVNGILENSINGVLYRQVYGHNYSTTMDVLNKKLESIEFVFRINPYHDSNRTEIKPVLNGYVNDDYRQIDYKMRSYGNSFIGPEGYYLKKSQGEVDSSGNYICTKDAYMHWEVTFKYVGE